MHINVNNNSDTYVSSIFACKNCELPSQILIESTHISHQGQVMFTSNCMCSILHYFSAESQQFYAVWVAFPHVPYTYMAMFVPFSNSILQNKISDSFLIYKDIRPPSSNFDLYFKTTTPTLTSGSPF